MKKILLSLLFVFAIGVAFPGKSHAQNTFLGPCVGGGTACVQAHGVLQPSMGGTGTGPSTGTGFAFANGPFAPFTYIKNPFVASINGSVAPVVFGNGAICNISNGIQTCTFPGQTVPVVNAITSLAGDGTASGVGAVNFTLATVNSTVGTFGSSTQIPSFTVNEKGLITNISIAAVVASAENLTGLSLSRSVINSSLTKVGTLNGLSVISSFTAIGLVTNEDLQNSYITLGETKMILGNTLSSINGITVNGVNLSTSGNSDYYLNQTGTYTSINYNQLSGDIPIWNQNTTGQSATALSLANVPKACQTGYFLTGIQANGDAICGQINSSEVVGIVPAISSLIGDGTASGIGTATFTLATVNSNVGTFGSSTQIPSFTVNEKGLITGVSLVNISASAQTLSGDTLAPTILNSSLTSVGTLSSLAIAGSLTQSAGFAYLGQYNIGPGQYYPTFGIAGTVFSWNLSNGNGEATIWNSENPAVYINTGIRFVQQTAINSFRDLMFLRQDGNVGIGTISPTATLSVDGTFNVSDSGGNKLAFGEKGRGALFNSAWAGSGYRYLCVSPTGEAVVSNVACTALTKAP